MSAEVISVRNLSKKYNIGAWQGYRTLSDTIVETVKLPLRPLARRNRSKDARRHKNKTIWALKDVSFEVKRGEVIGVIGRNGAGKSTLLKILSKITEPTTGRIELRGRVGSLLEVGTGFHPELTGHENVYLYGAILGMDRYEVTRKFDEIVAFAEIEKFVDTPVKRFSSGMYMRLAFAVAAHLEPEILLVDEVLAVGDAAFQKKCLGKMGEVSKEGRTVLFVSHNMGAITSLCQKAILLDQGSVLESGKAAVVTRKYLTQQFAVNKNNSHRGFTTNIDLIKDKATSDFSFENIELINSSDNLSGPKTGDPLIIKVNYISTKNFLSPAFAVSVKSYFGQEVFRLSTRPISGFTIDKIFPRGVVELSLETLPLVAGNYYLDVGFARENVEWIVRLERVVEFEVAPNDVYQSGTLLDQSAGLMVLSHEWMHAATE